MPVVQEEEVTKNSFLDGVTDTSVKWWGEGVVDIMWVTALDLEWSYAWLTMPLVSDGKSNWSALGSQLSRNPHPPQGSSQADCVTHYLVSILVPETATYWASTVECLLALGNWNMQVGFLSCDTVQIQGTGALIKQASGSSPLRVWLELWIPSKPGYWAHFQLFIYPGYKLVAVAQLFSS